MKTISTAATSLDDQGYIIATGLTVIDHGYTISIGATEHSKSDLTITYGRIISIHGWEVLI